MSSTRRASAEALLAALLFGAAAPAGKLLVGEIPPLLLAGLLYLGAAAGVAPTVWLEARRTRRAGFARGGGVTAVRSERASRWRLTGAIAAGGVVAPVLLLAALREADASSVSLLLNLELAATALLGVAFFGEHAGGRAWAGILGAVVAGLILSTGGGAPGLVAGALAAGACLFWGLDNQWTALVDGLSPARSTLWKGLVAGGANVALGLAGLGGAFAGGGGAELPAAGVVLAALLVGALSYGVSIALHVSASQGLGATRAQALFAASPFFGAAMAVAALGEPFGIVHAGASVLFAASVALVIADRHAHAHSHAATSHVHSHRHDDGHHGHVHPGEPASLRHSHWHDHEPVTHAHPHASDLHHRHDHA